MLLRSGLEYISQEEYNYNSNNLTKISLSSFQRILIKYIEKNINKIWDNIYSLKYNNFNYLYNKKNN